MSDVDDAEEKMSNIRQLGLCEGDYVDGKTTYSEFFEQTGVREYLRRKQTEEQRQKPTVNSVMQRYTGSMYTLHR